MIYTIGGIAVGRWPLLRANRTVITLLGAALLLGTGALTLAEAYTTLDLNTLLLLFSMMVLNGHLFLAGFFQIVTQRVVRAARSPSMLLALIIGASGVSIAPACGRADHTADAAGGAAGGVSGKQAARTCLPARRRVDRGRADAGRGCARAG